MKSCAYKWVIWIVLLGLILTVVWWLMPRSAPPAMLPVVAAVSVQMMPTNASLAAHVTIAPAQPVRSTVDAFYCWAEDYAAAKDAEKLSLVAEGIRLAEARGAAMARLIHDAPEAAVTAMLPYHLRKALPPEITERIEYPVRGSGELLVLAVCPGPGQTVEEPIVREVKIGGDRYKAYTYGHRLQQITTEVTPILGVGVKPQTGPALLALRDLPYEVLEKDEASALKTVEGQGNIVCPISGTPTSSSADETALHIGSKIVWLASPALVNQWLQTPDGLILMEAGGSGSSGGTSTVTPATHTTGNKKFLAIRVRFTNQAANYEPVSDTVLNSSLQTTVDKFREWSYGKLESTYDYTPTLDLPQADSWYYANGQEDKLRTDAIVAAAAYDDGAGNHPYASPETNFDFQAVVFNGSVSDGVYAGLASVGGNSLWMRAPENPILWLHEWGHNFGLGHANLWDVTSDSPIGPGVHAEYANNHSVMGGNSSNYGPYNTFERYSIHWLESANVVTPTTNGTYRIYNPDNTSLTAGHPYGMRVVKSTGLTYCIEFRPDWTPTADFTADNGALISWTQNNELLDMTPLSAAGQGDAPLLIGRSFADAAAKLTFTPISRGGTSPDDYLDVVVNFTDPLSNSPPVAVVTASTYTPVVNSSITLTAVASDPDGDTLAYSWDFGDGGNASVNNSATQTKSWSTAGDYNVRCTVSDRRGKTAVQNIVIHVGTPATFTISGRVTESDGTPVQDVLIQDANDHITYTDADGCYTLGALAANSYTLSALHEGWTFTNQFKNPLVIGPSVVNIDFTATGGSGAIPPTMPNTITVSATDASASETGPDTGTFAITRTGPTTAALTVYFDVTGTATYNSDYQPTGLSATILAGAATTTVTLTPIDDTVAEGDETVVLQLSPAITYTLGGATSGTITIHDNEATQVSVEATDSTASETGGDTGTFTITRTGNNTSALTVNFTMGGSASNGTDYTTLTSPVTIPANQSSMAITLSPINDGVIEVDETVILTLASGAGYAIGTASNATVRILAQAGNGGGILREWYDFAFYYYPGGTIGDLIGCSRYPFTTSGSAIVTDVFEAPQSNPGKDYFGERWRAFFIAPVTGNYIFSIASDNSSELWLSLDATPERKSRICYANSPTGFRIWTAQPSQTSSAIALTAGQRYYIEALFKESTGGDYMSVGVQYPNGALERPIPASRLDPYTPASPLPASWTGTNFGNGPVGSAGVEADFIPAAPKHRYSFSGTANAAITAGTSLSDSIGGATAVLRGISATYNSNGSGIDLPGGTSSTQAYIDLPNGVVTGTYSGGTRYTSATYEAWVTMSTVQSWARIFDFGTSSSGEVGFPGGTFNGTDTHHVALSANNGKGSDQQLSRNYPSGTPDVYSDAHSSSATGTQYHVVLVYDAADQNWRWYRNGLLMQTLPDTQGLTTLDDVNNWLGRSMVSTDSNLDGFFDEFRIYDYALTEAQIRGNKTAGANKVNTSSDGTFGPLWVSGSAFLSTAGATDTCHFEAQTLTCDFTVQTKLLQLVENSSSAFGGLMIREGTAANARHAFIGLNSLGLSRFIKRTTAAGNASYSDLAGLVFPQWLRLVRTGDTIVASVSSNGVSWTQQGSATTYTNLPASLQVGLAVSSGNTKTSAMAQFDEFKTTVLVTYPSVIVTPSNSSTNGSPILFTFTFSTAVTGLAASDITVSNGTKGALAGSGTTYTLPITPSGQGAVTCQVIASAAKDASGNDSTASNIATVTYDTVAPTGVVTPSGTATNTSPILFSLTFSEPVTGLTASGVTVSNGTKGTLAGSGTTYTLPVTPSGQGTVTCKVNASAAKDAAGNNCTASSIASMTYDSIAPTVVVTPSGTTTGISPMVFTLTFSKSVTGLNASGVTVGNGTKGALAGSGTTYTLPVTPSGQGVVTCQVNASAAQDAAGNDNMGSNMATISYDSVGPSVVIDVPSAGVTVNGPVTYGVTYSDANFNASTLAAGDITLNCTGTANGTVAVTGSGTTRTVTISSITGDGTLGISLAAGTASDTLGHLADAVGPSETFLVTSVGPIIKANTGTDLTLGASWTNGTTPTSGTVAGWISTSLGASLTLSNATAWGGINIAGAAATVAISGPGPLTLGSGGIALLSANRDLSISTPITLVSSQTWNVNTGRTLTASGIISGPVLLTKTGAGTLTLSGTNTFSGGLNIKAGAVMGGSRVAQAFGVGRICLGDSSGSANATILLQNDTVAVTNNILVQAGSSGNTLTINISGNNNAPLTGSVALNNNLVLANTSGYGKTLTLSGPISGAGNITITNKASAGMVTLSGNSINFTGSISNLGTGPQATTISGNMCSNVTGVIQNSATSKLILSGTNTYTGTTWVRVGTLETTRTNCLNVASSVVIADGAKMVLNFTGTNTIRSLKLGSVYMPKGVYGTNTPPSTLFFSGSGALNVLTGPPGTTIRLW
jgi:autotransporter-associated beta strand protein